MKGLILSLKLASEIHIKFYLPPPWHALSLIELKLHLVDDDSVAMF